MIQEEEIGIHKTKVPSTLTINFRSSLFYNIKLQISPLTQFSFQLSSQDKLLFDD